MQRPPLWPGPSRWHRSSGERRTPSKSCCSGSRRHRALSSRARAVSVLLSSLRCCQNAKRRIATQREGQSRKSLAGTGPAPWPKHKGISCKLPETHPHASRDLNQRTHNCLLTDPAERQSPIGACVQKCLHVICSFHNNKSHVTIGRQRPIKFDSRWKPCADNLSL